MSITPFDPQIRSLLSSARAIAVVGLSPKPERPSHRVAAYLLEQGYTIFPVNPGQRRILGRTCHPDLTTIGEPVDVVDIFRDSRHVLPIVEQAVAIGARAVWMQQGVINQEAAELAEKAGLLVVMDRCLKVDHARLLSR